MKTAKTFNLDAFSEEEIAAATLRVFREFYKNEKGWKGDDPASFHLRSWEKARISALWDIACLVDADLNRE